MNRSIRVSAQTIARLKDAVGPIGAVSEAERLAPHLSEWRGRYRGSTPLMLMPATTADVARIVAICAETKTPLVPQGGNTGLVGGQIPMAGEILLSLKRMNRIRALDPFNATLTAEAGCILADIQRAAADADRLFPLSLASEGSCTIGGVLSTNAGGNAVLRYGTARDLVLGLEVVLPNGKVLDLMRGLRKDNTGYDLKQLFVGAEGTLGIITAAVLKLHSRPAAIETAIAGLQTVENAVSLLAHAKRQSGDQVTAFELIPRIGLEFVLRHVPGTLDPLGAPHPWYALIELSAGGPCDTLRSVMEAMLAQALEKDLLDNAVLAESEAQRAEFWRLRDSLSEVQKHEGGSIKCDIAVPISAVASFIARATEAVTHAAPGVRPVVFGHLGDGNVHFNLSQPLNTDRNTFLARWDELSEIVQSIAANFGGSISAEHGLGQMKRTTILNYKSDTEMALMRSIKRTLDPDNIMNPGKVV